MVNGGVTHDTFYTSLYKTTWTNQQYLKTLSIHTQLTDLPARPPGSGKIQDAGPVAPGRR